MFCPCFVCAGVRSDNRKQYFARRTAWLELEASNHLPPNRKVHHSIYSKTFLFSIQRFILHWHPTWLLLHPLAGPALEPVHLQGCGIHEGPSDARQVVGMQLLGLAAAAARQGPQQRAPVHGLEVAGALNFAGRWDAGGSVIFTKNPQTSTEQRLNFNIL